MPLIHKVSHVLNKIVWTAGETAEDKLKLVREHKKSTAIMKVIMRLDAEGLMSRPLLFDDLIHSRCYEALSEAYLLLNKNNLFSEGNVLYFREILNKHSSPKPLAAAFVRLSTAGILSSGLGSRCSEVLAKSTTCYATAEAFILFYELEKLTEETIAYIDDRKNLKSMVEGIKLLKNAGLLLGDEGKLYFDKMIKIQKTGGFIQVMFQLQALELWNDSHFKRLGRSSYPIDALSRILTRLTELDILLGDSGLGILDYLLSRRELAKIDEALFTLQINNFLNDKRYHTDCIAIIKHKMPTLAAQAFISLHKAGLMDEWITTAVFGSKFPVFVSELVEILNQYKLLTKLNYEKIINHAEKVKIIWLLERIMSKNTIEELDGESLFTSLLNHKNIDDLYIGLKTLYDQNFVSTEFSLSKDILSLLLTHPTLVLVVNSMIRLKKEGLLSPSTAQLLLESDDVNKSCRTMLALYKNGLFIENNYVAAMKQLSKGQHSYLLTILSQSSMLLIGEGAQARFEVFVSYPNILLDFRVIKKGWAILTRQLLDAPGVLGRIIDIVQQYQDDPALGQTEVIAYIRAQVTIEEQARGVFNHHQTTHTTSINKTVSESATRLKERYYPGILEYMEAMRKEITTFYYSTEDESDLYRGAKKTAANKAIDRLLSGEGWAYKDPLSQVKTIELFHFIWAAMHDEELRVGTLIDAKHRFIDALYEIQRGRNINEAGVDVGGDDAPICAGGTFNKLIEALVHIHPDVQLVFVSQDGAALKFKIVVIEEAMFYLLTLATSVDCALHEQFRQFTDKIKPHQGLPTELWDLISVRVSDRMFDEFQSLYPEGKDSEAFKGLMSSGEYVSLNPNNFIKMKELLDNLPLPEMDLQLFDVPDFSEAAHNRNSFFNSSSLESNGSFGDRLEGDDAPSKRRRVE